MADVPEQSAQWRVHECLLDLGHETSFADSCVDRDRRPLVLVWGDLTAGALLPGLRKAQKTRRFRHRAVDLQLMHPGPQRRHRGDAQCRAINDKVMALARQIKPDIVLLHGTWDRPSRQRGRDGDGAEAPDHRARHRSGCGAGVEARVAVRGAARTICLSSPDSAALE